MSICDCGYKVVRIAASKVFLMTIEISSDRLIVQFKKKSTRVRKSGVALILPISLWFVLSVASAEGSHCVFTRNGRFVMQSSFFACCLEWLLEGAAMRRSHSAHLTRAKDSSKSHCVALTKVC
jgi:hypothetical protein